jgi:hypothetical protein
VRRRRGEDEVAGRRRTWLDGRVDVLLAALDEYGMSASAVSAAELIQERVQWVAAQMRVTPATARRYLTDEAVRDLARTMALTVADEAPGADLLASPRTAAVPVPVLGRCIAGLAEAIVLRLAERDDLGHVRTTTAQLAQALSALGQVIADCQRSTGNTVTGTACPDVLAPPALLNRAARYLEAAAALARTGGVVPDGFDPPHAAQLAGTFEADAMAARYYADGA